MAKVKPNDGLVMIMRRPIFMEDEGGDRLIKRCTLAEAKEWIRAQAREFYRPGDYYIAQKIPLRQAPKKAKV